MDGRGNDVRRALTGELQDELAEIGLQDLHAAGLEVVIEPDFLGHHGLALDQASRAAGLEDAMDDLIGLVRRLCPVDLDAVSEAVGFERLQQLRQTRKRAALQRRAGGPQALTRGGVRQYGEPLLHEPVHGAADIGACLGITQGLVYANAEFSQGHGYAPRGIRQCAGCGYRHPPCPGHRRCSSGSRSPG